MRHRREHYSTDLMDRIGEHWSTRAACVGYDPELWFALPGTDEETRAKSVCDHCPVIAQCDEWATTTGQRYGMWAGRRREDQQDRFRQHYRICSHCRSAYWCTAPHQQYCNEQCQNRAALARKRKRDRERRRENAARYGNDLAVV